MRGAICGMQNPSPDETKPPNSLAVRVVPGDYRRQHYGLFAAGRKRRSSSANEEVRPR